MPFIFNTVITTVTESRDYIHENHVIFDITIKLFGGLEEK